MDIVCAEDYRVRIPNRIYEAQCVKYDDKFVLSKTRKLFLNFRIVDFGEHNGKEIFMPFNMPYDGKVRPGSKYYKTWCMVNGWRKPSRNTKMSPKLFLNKVYKVKIRTARPMHNGKEMPEQFWYSVVDSIIEVLTGEPEPIP